MHIIYTGGTIDKTYNPVTEKPELNDAPTVNDYLSDVIKPHIKITSERVCLKDSLDLNDDDRAHIAKAVQTSTSAKIIIVHGTSTMEVTAKYLKGELLKCEKTIVLTGAMIPLKDFAMSDAGFNLGYALAHKDIMAGGHANEVRAHLAGITNDSAGFNAVSFGFV